MSNYADRFKLVVNVPHDDNVDENLFKFLSNKPYTHAYFYGTQSKPNMRRIVFVNLTERDIAQVKNDLRLIYTTSTYISFCSFQVLSNNENVE